MRKAKYGSKWTPPQTGKQGLFRLIEQAQDSYQTEVITRQKNYKRYVLDFIRSKQYHDATDAWSKNEHQKNYYTVVDLLSDHEKLVRRYFDREVFDENGISDLLSEFYSFGLSPTPVGISEEKSVKQNSPTSNTVESILNSETIGLIVQLANEVNLFKEVLDSDEINSRYSTNTLQPVTSANNTRLVLLLDRLASNGIISYNWQSIISKKRLVISSSGKKYLDQHDMSSTLNRIRDISPSVQEKVFFATIDKYIMLIKSKEL